MILCSWSLIIKPSKYQHLCRANNGSRLRGFQSHGKLKVRGKLQDNRQSYKLVNITNHEQSSLLVWDRKNLMESS